MPMVLILANLTLGLVLFLLHEWHVVDSAANPMLTQGYAFKGGAGAYTYAASCLLWGLLFLGLMLAQLGSIVLRRRLPYICVMTLTLISLMCFWL